MFFVLSKYSWKEFYIKSIVAVSIFSILFSLQSLAIISPKAYKSEPRIKIRIGSQLKQVSISGMDLNRKIHFGNNIKQYSGNKIVRFNCNSLLKNKSLSKPILLASLKSQTGLVSLKNDRFVGDLHVVTTPGNQSCDVVNETPIEDYISSLLSKEMNGTWPLEALKAQAIAARTYALHKIQSKQVSKKLGHNAFYDLESSEKHQVGGTFFDATKNTFLATRGTTGEILVSAKGYLTPIFFHAKCGGRTLRPEQVWSNPVDSYTNVDCPFCDSHGKKKWNGEITKVKFQKFLSWAKRKKLIKTSVNFKTRKKLIFATDRFSRYKLRIYWGKKSFLIKKTWLRRYFGRFIVSSNYYKLSMSKGIISIKGQGLGHGVGMCQLGALDLAKKGWDYKRILAHYFPKHNIRKVY